MDWQRAGKQVIFLIGFAALFVVRARFQIIAPLIEITCPEI
jgi:hypothetical protein